MNAPLCRMLDCTAFRIHIGSWPGLRRSRDGHLGPDSTLGSTPTAAVDQCKFDELSDVSGFTRQREQFLHCFGCEVWRLGHTYSTYT